MEDVMENVNKQGHGQWWLSEVETIVAGLVEEKANAARQEEIWSWIGRTLGPEAAAAAKRLFAGLKKPKEVDVEGPSFQGEQASPDDQPPILSKATPYDSAKEFVRRHCFEQGVLATYYWSGNFWKWNGCYYEKASADDVNRDL
jgi:hypothetical protein